MAQESQYRQIARDLRRKIREGELAPGARLGTEKYLEDQYEVSRSTVRMALGMLQNAGLVDSRPGRGTFVKLRVPVTYHMARDQLRDGGTGGVSDPHFADGEESIPRYSARKGRKVAEVQIEGATPLLASRLRVDEDTLIVVRRMYRFLDEHSSAIETSYYPMDITQNSELMIPEDIERGTLSVLAEQGYHQAGYVDELTTRMPSPEEAAQLGLGPGIPVLELYRTSYSDDRPLRLTWTVYAGDGARFQYEIGDVSAYFDE